MIRATFTRQDGAMSLRLDTPPVVLAERRRPSRWLSGLVTALGAVVAAHVATTTRAQRSAAQERGLVAAPDDRPAPAAGEILTSDDWTPRDQWDITVKHALDDLARRPPNDGSRLIARVGADGFLRAYVERDWGEGPTGADCGVCDDDPSRCDCDDRISTVPMTPGLSRVFEVDPAGNVRTHITAEPVVEYLPCPSCGTRQDAPCPDDCPLKGGA